ncbi:MAG: hypothetical protein ACNS60_16710 [Candidatus Cyclobacteriaceae bacterium M2_1C_046]
MTREQLEDKVQDLIDNKLSVSEAEDIKRQIKGDEYLSLYYTTLKELDAALHHIEPALPSEKFTDRVMSRLHEPKPKTIDLRSLLVFIGIIICIALGVIYAPQFSVPDISPVNEQLNMPVGEKVNVTLPGLNLPSSEIFLNTFYFGILFLALIYFDRVILRPLFKSIKYSY